MATGRWPRIAVSTAASALAAALAAALIAALATASASRKNLSLPWSAAADATRQRRLAHHLRNRADANATRRALQATFRRRCLRRRRRNTGSATAASAIAEAAEAAAPAPDAAAAAAAAETAPLRTCNTARSISPSKLESEL